MPWQKSLVQAIEAIRAGSYGVGAVIVDGSDDIVSVGRNRIFEEESANGEICGSCIAHAEINAIASLPKGVDRTELTLYTSLEPCPMCVGAIGMCGIKTVRYAARDPFVGCADLLDKPELLRREGIRAYGPETEALVNLSVALNFCGFLRKREPGEEHYLNHIFEPTAPHGVTLAMAIRSPRIWTLSSMARESLSHW